MIMLEGKPLALTMAIIDMYNQESNNADLAFSPELCWVLGIAYDLNYKQSIEKEIAVSASNLSFDQLMQMCAEMGKIEYFYQMTPKQIELGYKGYQEHLYNLGNLYIIADRRSKDSQAEPFTTIEQHSRVETLKKLGLEEQDVNNK